MYEVEHWNDLTHKHIRSWMVELVDKGIGPKSIRRKLSSLRALFLFFRKHDLVQSNPMIKVVAPKISKSLPETITRDRVEKLFDVIKSDSFADFRNRLIIELFYITGMRRAELMMLKDENIDYSNKQVKVLGKGNKERTIPLFDVVIVKIKKYLRLREEYFGDNTVDTYLFVTNKGKKLYPKWVYNMVKSYLSTITTQNKRSPHVLRHSFATHLLDAGAELTAIKDLLGHVNLSATQIYTHNSIEKLKNVYKSAHPKSV